MTCEPSPFSALPLITPHTVPVKNTQLQTLTYCSIISISRAKPKPDHHRLSTEQKNTLKGLSDSGSPHYWTHTAQVFPCLVNFSHCERQHRSTQCARATSHIPLGISCRLARAKASPKPQPSSLLTQQWLVCSLSSCEEDTKTPYLHRRTRKEQKYDQMTYSSEPTLLQAHLLWP